MANVEKRNEDSDRYYRLKRMKKWRLIVRNLPFTCTEDIVRSSFSPFGIIEELVLPRSKKDLSHNAGFAFVQFRKQESAEKAMTAMNENEISGRQVAVDWAVPKDQFMTAVLEEKDRQSKTKQAQSPEEKVVFNKTKDEKVKKTSVRVSKALKTEPDEAPSTSDSSAEEDDASDSAFSGSKKKRKLEDGKPKVEPRKDNGVEEGRTIFIRNIPFDAEDDELQKVFSPFGHLKYCVICKYPGTDHSKGSGFVQFVEKDAAQKCLEQGANEAGNGIKIRGQPLTICQAISKESAHQLEKQKHDHQPKDKRNLHLLRVGLIRAGTADAVGVSESDMMKRMRIEAANREKIKNFNIFVSPTRLCVHNLPSRVNDEQLGTICFEAVGDKDAWITECRIMRDLNRLNSLGVGKSRGFGFVEFSQHEHALKCLKYLNNNAEIFGAEKRPIVEFSLENRRALLVKEQRKEKARIKAAESKSEQQESPAAKSSTGGREKMTKLYRKSKFSVPNVSPPSGIKIEGGAKRKAFPSHFGPKIRHRKRDASKNDRRSKGASKNKLSRKTKKETATAGKGKAKVSSKNTERKQKKKSVSREKKRGSANRSERGTRWFAG